jgi:hypothetical protein
MVKVSNVMVTMKKKQAYGAFGTLFIKYHRRSNA